jgi:hypothetical protein
MFLTPQAPSRIMYVSQEPNFEAINVSFPDLVFVPDHCGGEEMLNLWEDQASQVSHNTREPNDRCRNTDLATMCLCHWVGVTLSRKVL